LVPASCGGDNFVWIGGPIKRSRLLVVVGDEAIDGGLKIDDAFEGAAPETPFCEDGEKAFDGVEPASGCGREVERPTPMPIERGDDLGVFMGGVVIEDGVDGFSDWDLALDGV
jgi:hypothetical protein